MTVAPSDNLTGPAAMPIGMFDSGMGGLTVLHECLVQLPGEHFAYVGDTARFPYGEKSRDDLELFSRQITAFLETVPCKLIVVACYSATSAALPALQERFQTPIIGVVMPGARAAVETSRYRKIGVLATEATVASGAYPRAIHSLDSGAEVIQQACPGLVDFIEAGDVTSQALADAVRGFTQPLKAQRPDVVIMGCTHYPLIQPMLQRFFGRDVTLVNPAAEIAREVEAMLLRQGLERPGNEMGSYRFYTTGDVERFRDIGARFLQMPLTRVRALSLEHLGGLAHRP
jgi:glutamate racemase